MAKPVDIAKLSVDELLSLRTDIDRVLIERRRDLEKQIALLGNGAEVKRRGRPPGSSGRVSAMRGKSVPPKYRGPGGETWAGRGATPRWLAALIKEGHSIEEFLIGAGRKRKTAAARKKEMKKKAARPVRKPRQAKEAKTTAEAAAT